ncbi:M23 family metallopeptidase [Siphonobacter sp. SORGH_AS_1065]|uniref:M23 family metallopeptidase n=1 Tax=Siphonobacter sp. SORGH_AS_1065 TaxID=3041795 RepID=UPI0027854D2C|nr:M23 family metallopeptidase [Siphonobacter sp. SORGH_AS_1065]MDQ1090449.1 murein DD-endopeptidase MepM/ murein hydrolase activator NlpD [Siphonobacter sp. SORGH_AS_1065]
MSKKYLHIVFLLSFSQVIASSPVRTVSDSSKQQPSLLWARTTIMKSWERFNEKEMLQYYIKCPDPVLKSYFPAILPLVLEEGDMNLSSSFGFRVHPIDGHIRKHLGVDLTASKGQPVYATLRGIVQTGYQSGYGLYVKISNQFYSIILAHLSSIIVKTGDVALPYTCIGQVGSSGKSTGNHLHYEVRFKGQPTDPGQYMFLNYQ